MKIGYKLSSEEFDPLDLVCFASQAEDAGFDFAMISDHYHPWIGETGESPFVWSTIGGISQVTENLPIITGVTCPTFRIHPAIIAHAAATAASMLPERFILGVGSGENLNEHVLGNDWPSTPKRIDMLAEAIYIIKALWEGGEGLQDYEGFYYKVENAKIYTKPAELPPIYIAAEGEMAATLAGNMGDGLIAQHDNEKAVEIFKNSGGEGKPCYAEATLCWDENKDEAIKTALKYWPIKANDVQINTDIPTTFHFERLAQLATEDIISEEIVCSEDPQDHINEIKKYAKAGYDHICLHQVGPNQHEFIELCRDEILQEFK
ncbi:TIGR03557 family F420-dependent LLM class oxidoreductase [Methanobacterium oryzae]|uniref:TIGR03557 family F420-dependent LLM class oxidoreductase n=1 Tax=Methanobacterium oryzae TaxID=69540 RepID=UPI003D1ECBC1